MKTSIEENHPSKSAPRRPGRRRRVIFALLVLALSGAISLLLAEIVVRVLAPQNLSGTWRVLSARGYMMNKADGLARHQVGDRIVRYRFNAMHLRGGPVKQDGRRVLVLGDSFTFGWLLQEPDTYVHRLERMAEQRFGPGEFQFLNGGAGGWGTADYVAFVEDFGPTIEPDAILVFLGVFDLSRSLGSPLYKPDPNQPALLVAGKANRRDAGLKRMLNGLPFYQWLLEHSHLVQLARIAYIGRDDPPTHAAGKGVAAAHSRDDSRSPDVDKDQKDPQVERGVLLFRRLKRWCADRSVTLVVTTTGFESRRFGLAVEGGVDARFHERVASLLAAEGVDFFRTDLDDPGLASAEDLVIPGDGHPNELAARFIAERVWPWLEGLLENIPDRADTLRDERTSSSCDR